MIVRIAVGRSLPRGVQSRFFSSSRSKTEKERNIFVEAEEEKEEEPGGRSLLEEQRARMAREPVWDGDERLQDTILRMVMDKHQPLRVKGGGGGQHPADVKMTSIQKPSMLSSPSFATPSSSAALVDVSQVGPELPPPVGEEGRRLPKTPADKPWLAVYVNPVRREGLGEGAAPSVHYGRYLGLPAASRSSRSLPRTATGKERLKMAGIKAESLPLDDHNKMKAIREGVRRWDRAGRVRGVREEAFKYRRAREEEKGRGKEQERITEYDLEEYLDGQEALKEGEEIKLTSGSSDSKPGDAVVAMSGGRGFTSLANERIEAAMKTDYFRRNTLRGKPLENDVHAMNPFLSGEERIMNRLIKRQGASPPWVELNSQVDSETNDWRARLADNWLRRASRMILSSPHLRRGLEPVQTGGSLALDSLASVPFSTGQQRLIDLVRTYRDPEWEAREEEYHRVSLKEVNDVIRKYNIVAPASVRKGLLVRGRELERAYEESRGGLMKSLSEGLSPSASSLPPSIHAQPLAGRWKSTEARAGTSASPTSPSHSSRAGSAAVTTGGGEDAGGGPSAEDAMARERAGPLRIWQFTTILKQITQRLVGR